MIATKEPGGISVGIMQPYFFPYLGYFQLMSAVDQWVYFDTPQYIRKGWVNRNRILTRGKDEWKFIRIPVQKMARETPICDIKIAPDSKWRNDIYRGLDYYKENNAPFYRETCDFVEDALNHSSPLLADVIIHSLNQCIDYLDIQLDNPIVFSKSKMEIGDVQHAGQWALRISEWLKADTYINPPGGREIFNADEFRQSAINLRFLEPKLEEYSQGGIAFVPGLSIIDCLMWNGQRNTRQYIQNIEITS